MKTLTLSELKEIAELGRRIYRDRYKTSYEKEHQGKFVAIDVHSRNAYLGDTALQAIDNGLNFAPDGLFHLIKIGSAAAFHLRRTGAPKIPSSPGAGTHTVSQRLSAGRKASVPTAPQML